MSLNPNVMESFPFFLTLLLCCIVTRYTWVFHPGEIGHLLFMFTHERCHYFRTLLLKSLDYWMNGQEG